MKRCTGHCCRSFPLPWSPEGLRAALADTVAGRQGWEDIEIIQPMVIPIEKAEPAVAECNSPVGKGQDEWWLYTCRHLDTESGDCQIYESRPKMCQDYGKAYPCSTPGCTWEKAMREIGPRKQEEAPS